MAAAIKFAFLIIILGVFISEGLIHWVNENHKFPAEFDWIVLLGNGSNVSQPVLKDRILNTIEASHLNPNARILITGDSKKNEVAPIREYLLKNGINESTLVVDEVSRSTWQSAQNSKKLSENKSKIIVITNEFHQARAVASFRVHGLEAYPFGRDLHKYSRASWYFLRERFSRLKWLAQYTWTRVASK